MKNYFKLIWIAITNSRELQRKIDVYDLTMESATRNYKGDFSTTKAEVYFDWREVATHKDSVK